MKYFEKQEQAVAVFNKLAEVTQTEKTVFLIVRRNFQVDALTYDLSVLLQDKNLRVEKGNIRIKGTIDTPAKSLIILSEDNSVIPQLKQSQVVNVQEICDDVVSPEQIESEYELIYQGGMEEVEDQKDA